MTSDYEKTKVAAAALEEAYEAVFRVARPGMTAEEIDCILREKLKARGGELKPSGISPFLVDEAGAPPKMRINRAPLEKDRLWAMDNSISVGGYWADIGRYGYIGRLPENLKADHAKVLARQDFLASQVKPGRPMDAIFRACQQDMSFEIHRIATEANMMPFCGNSTEGVKKAMAESVQNGMTFLPGQVVCVEIWAGLMGGIEDMYLVTQTGLERITTLPREIRVIAG